MHKSLTVPWRLLLNCLRVWIMSNRTYCCAGQFHRATFDFHDSNDPDSPFHLPSRLSHTALTAWSLDDVGVSLVRVDCNWSSQQGVFQVQGLSLMNHIPSDFYTLGNINPHQLMFCKGKSTLEKSCQNVYDNQKNPKRLSHHGKLPGCGHFAIKSTLSVIGKIPSFKTICLTNWIETTYST